VSTTPDSDKRVREAHVLAQVSCLMLGLGMLLWGLAPVVIPRLAGRTPPQLEMLALNSFTLLLGVTFLALSLLIRRGTTWALHATAWLALVLLVVSVSLYAFGGGPVMSLFPTLLTTGAAVTSWYALATRRMACQDQQPT
jgi:hypothetical protein